MADRSSPWRLAIDFGTSFTVAAVRVDGRAPEAIEIDGERRMPTVVLVADDGALVVGRAADDLASGNPGRALRAPKRWLGDPAPVVLGGRPYQVTDLVAAVLRHVYDEAVRHQGSPPTSVHLTHPATWTRPRLARLLEAAATAGLAQPVLVAEPAAAARWYATEVGVPDGAHVAVYDLGGGTFDTTVLRATDGRFAIVGRPGGDGNLGGDLFDELLFHSVGERLDPATWEALQASEDVRWRRAALALRAEVRRAKEALTSAPYAELLVPLPGGLVELRLTRDELEAVVAPYVDDSVRLFEQCVRDAGVDPTTLDAVYLVGGGSRMPLVERRLAEAVDGVPISRRGDPKTAVALGATLVEPVGTVAEDTAAAGATTPGSAPGRAPAPAPVTVVAAGLTIADDPSQATAAGATVAEATVADPATVVATDATVAEGSTVDRPVARSFDASIDDIGVDPGSSAGRRRPALLVGLGVAAALVAVLAVLAGNRGGDAAGVSALTTSTSATPAAAAGSAASAVSVVTLATTTTSTVAASTTTEAATTTVAPTTTEPAPEVTEAPAVNESAAPKPTRATTPPTPAAPTTPPPTAAPTTPPPTAAPTTEPPPTTPANRPPVALLATYSAVSSNEWSSACVLQRASDPDGDPLEIAGVGAAPAGGTAYVGAPGGTAACPGQDTVVFRWAPGWTGVASISFQVVDGRGGSAWGEVRFTIGSG